MPKVEKILKIINKNKILCGVISNKDSNLLRKEINKLGWKKYFHVLVGANEAKKERNNHICKINGIFVFINKVRLLVPE